MRLYSSVDELTIDLKETLICNFKLQGYRVFLCDDDEDTINLLNSSESTAEKRVLRSQVDPYIRSDFSFENGNLFSDFTSSYGFPLISDEEFTGYLFIAENPDQDSLGKDELDKIYNFKDELGTYLDHLRLKLRVQRAETQELLGSISHGLDIPQEFIDSSQLYKPFSQVDDTPTRTYGGLGLGLALCKNLCSHIDAKLEVESKPGEGSRFLFVVPVRKVSLA